MNRIITILTCLLALCSVQAETSTLTNRQADELLGALQHIDAGFTAANVTKTARNILALRSVVDTWSQGNDAARAKYKINRATREDSPEAAAYVAEINASALDKAKIELSPLALTEEEITQSHLTPAVYAVLLKYLGK